MPPRTRPQTYLFFAACFGLILFLTHAPLLGLPLHWDELGYFVPAALDLFRNGAWVPFHTLPNIHPPGLSVYLAAAWTLTGYSIPATRAAMLLLATLAALASFLLAIELTAKRPGFPAFGAVVLLLASPLFFTQSMMAQLDLPAMLFCTLALLWFLQGRIGLCVAACVVAVLVKETSLIAPLVFGLWLARDRRWKQAALFVLPALALAAWIIVLRHSTGNAVGNAEFGWYNLVYPLHPVRLAGALLRRVSYLFVEEFRWIGTIAVVVAFRRRLFRTREWRIAGSFALAQALFVTVLGGAVLERYLLPVLPVLYTAFAVSFRGRLSLLLATAGLVVCNFWYPPLWPFPQENNLAIVDYVRVQQAAAQYLETSLVNTDVVTTWPMADALRNPDFGYVSRPLPVRAVDDFSAQSLHSGPIQTLVLYSRDWDPPHNLLRTPFIEPLYRKYFRFHPPVTADQLRSTFGLVRVARWSRGSQWVEVWSR